MYLYRYIVWCRWCHYNRWPTCSWHFGWKWSLGYSVLLWNTGTSGLNRRPGSGRWSSIRTQNQDSDQSHGLNHYLIITHQTNIRASHICLMNIADEKCRINNMLILKFWHIHIWYNMHKFGGKYCSISSSSYFIPQTLLFLDSQTLQGEKLDVYCLGKMLKYFTKADVTSYKVKHN